MKLNPSQAWHLQWVAAAYPRAFREISRSTAMNSLVRKGLATKLSVGGVNGFRRYYSGAKDRLADFRLTHDGLKALADVNQELWAHVSDYVDDQIISRDDVRKAKR